MAQVIDGAEALRERVAQLEHALRSRIVIEQAKGVLAERHALTIPAAFELLRGAARSNRLRIHDLAAQVVPGHDSPRAILERLP